jgi:hypothetical protein
MPAMVDDGADVEDGERMAGEEGDSDGEEGGPTSRYLVSAAAGERLRRPPPSTPRVPPLPHPPPGYPSPASSVVASSGVAGSE